MKRIILFFSLAILFLSCSDNEEKAKVISASEKWIKENVITLYKAEEKPILLSTKEDIETESNFKYLYKKYEWKGALESEHNFLEYDQKGLQALNIYNEYSKSTEMLEPTEESISHKNYLSDWTKRSSELLESSSCEMDIKNTSSFFVIRYVIKYKNLHPAKNVNTEQYNYDMIDIILDENFNVINSL